MSRTTKNRKAADYLSRAPNYSGEAINDLSGFAKVASDRGAVQTALILNELVRGLLSGHKFALPRGGRTFDDDLSVSMVAEFRLPYAMTVFEFEAVPVPRHATMVRGGMPFSPVPRRIAVCIEWDSWSTPFPASMRTGSPSGCVIWPIGYREVGRNKWMWLADGSGVSIGYSPDAKRAPATSAIEALGITQEDGSPFKRMGFSFEVRYPCLGEFGRESMAHLSQGQREAAVALDTKDELAAVIQACAALACTNVTTEILRPNREARAARPASTLFDYHVLMIDPSKDQNPSEDHGGTHASPRTHLRRGHIRRLAWGPRVWVNSCVVNPGAVGTVNKDYAVKRGGD